MDTADDLCEEHRDLEWVGTHRTGVAERSVQRQVTKMVDVNNVLKWGGLGIVYGLLATFLLPQIVSVVFSLTSFLTLIMPLFLFSLIIGTLLLAIILYGLSFLNGSLRLPMLTTLTDFKGFIGIVVFSVVVQAIAFIISMEVSMLGIENFIMENLVLFLGLSAITYVSTYYILRELQMAVR